MLQKSPVPFLFAKGIDTKTNPHVQMVGSLLELENATLNKVGQITKRSGYEALSTEILNGTDIGVCDGLATYGDGNELLAFGNGRMYSFAEAAEKWLDRGAVVNVAMTEQPVVRNTYAQGTPDVARLSGMTCSAWEEEGRGGVRYTLTDDESGTPYVADVEVSTAGTRPRVVAHDASFFIFYAIGNNIFYRRVTIAAPLTLGPQVNPIADMNPATMAFDIVSGPAISESLYILYDSTASSGRLATMTSPYNSTTVTLLTSYTAFTSCSLWSDAFDNVWAAYSSASTQYVSSLGVLTETTVASNTNIVRCAGAAYAESGRVRVFFEQSAASSYNHDVFHYVVTGGTVSAQQSIRSVGLSAKPFVYGERCYVPCVHESTFQSTTFVVDAESGAVVSKSGAGLAGGLRDRATLSATVSTTTGVYVFAATVTTALESGDGGRVYTRNGIALTTLDFTNAKFQTAELAGALMLAGGVVQMYDGKHVVEHGFHLHPENITGVANAAAGALTAGESYSWLVNYEWTDATGRVHVSTPGQVTIGGSTSFTAAANDAVTLTIPTLRLTAKTQVRIVVYRTEGNGTVFYRVNPNASPLLNDPTVETVTYQDTLSDASLTARQIHYMTGEVLYNIAPASSSVIAAHAGRVFLAGGIDPNVVAYSKPVEATGPVEFNDAQYLRVEGRGESVTALASLDDKLIVFKRNAAFAVFGDGPSATGQGEFSNPQLITADVGCVEPRSVVSSAAGVMFKTAKGIYLLDRGLAVSYIGAPVEGYNSETITSATLVSTKNQVRFTTASGVGLVYDYDVGQWSTFTNHDAVDAVVWDDVFTMGKASGAVWRETPGVHEDPEETVTWAVTTGWISPAGIQGYLRLYRMQVLGHYKSAHRLRVQIGYDFKTEFSFDETLKPNDVISASENWGSDATWGSGSVWGGEFPRYKWEIVPTTQKCESFRVRLEEVQYYGAGVISPSAGEGAALSAISFLIGAKGARTRIEQSRYKA